MHYYGVGIPVSKTSARRWLETIPSEQRAPKVIFLLALMHARGEGGFRQNYGAAATLYRQAARDGYSVAQQNLANLYRRGLGVSRDICEALRWYMKAAAQDYPLSMASLGDIFKEGEPGVTVNSRLARQYYQRGAALGNAECQYDLARCLLEVDPPDKDMALFWFRQALTNGYKHADCNGAIGYVLYCKGAMAEAVAHYRVAAEAGESYSQCNLGYMYCSGQGVSTDHVQAVYWFRKAAEQGDAQAHCNLAEHYESGDGVTQDLAKAIVHYTAAAQRDGHAKAIGALERLAKSGRATAAHSLATVYLNGHAQHHDCVSGIRWHMEAARLGDQNSINALQTMRRDSRYPQQAFTLAERLLTPPAPPP